MCSNRKIRPDWERGDEKPKVLVLDEFNRARPEVLNQLLTLVQDRPFPHPGLTKETHWNLIKHRIEREDEDNRS